MNHSPPKSQSLSAERRPTSIFLYPFPKPPSCSHMPIFKIDFGKENIPPQKISWEQYSQSLYSLINMINIITIYCFLKEKANLKIQSQTDSKIKFKFPLYTDHQLGIKSEFQNLLQEAYDNDDDINIININCFNITRESVMNFFIDVCKRDLIQGIIENQQIKDQKGNPILNFSGLTQRLSVQYESMNQNTE